MHDTELMQNLNYNLDDLYENRNMKLSYKQFSKLKKVRIRSVVLPTFIAFLALAFAVHYATLPAKETREYLTLVIAAILSLIFALAGVSRWARLSNDLRSQKVEVIHGNVSLGAAETRNIGYQALGFRLVINDTVFILPSKARRAFDARVPYSIYYLPNSRIVVSAERK